MNDIDYLERYQLNGCEHAKTKLTQEYIPIINRIAKKFVKKSSPVISEEDLVEDGALGLLNALEGYDSSKGTKFKTYAERKIGWAIQDGLREMDWASRSVRNNTKKIENTKRTLEQKLGREPKDFEIADEMDISLEKYHEINMNKQGFHYPFEILENSMIQSSNLPLPSEIIESNKTIELLRESIQLRCSKEEQKVLKLYYDDDMSQKDIGKVLGLSDGRISQIHIKAKIKLKRRLAPHYSSLNFNLKQT
ncbi:FliA/WhiG family RNA polymerase sigma factor [Candidatus Pacearchaeota archaeon]|nr:FliA/WhiG family RNA polymerase sigma factor [Candidatus Pacearchaeota archaeon]